jgi:hypothetical protein
MVMSSTGDAMVAPVGGCDANGDSWMKRPTEGTPAAFSRNSM